MSRGGRTSEMLARLLYCGTEGSTVYLQTHLSPRARRVVIAGFRVAPRSEVLHYMAWATFKFGKCVCARAPGGKKQQRANSMAQSEGL